MTVQPLIQFGTITLNPTPDRRVICLQTALGKQLLHIGKRQRVPKIPAHSAKNQLWCRLPPLEDRWSSCHCGLHLAYQLAAFRRCNTTRQLLPPIDVAHHHRRENSLGKRQSCWGGTSFDEKPIDPFFYAPDKTTVPSRLLACLRRRQFLDCFL